MSPFLRYVSFCSMALIAACSSSPSETDTATPAADGTYPQHNKETRRESRGSATGEGGLFSFGRHDDEEKSSSGGTIGVNSYLWRATLDSLSFMPFVSADPFGGTVITDWYEDPETPGERFKVNAVILDKTLRADGVRVSVFKQTRDKVGQWRDTTVSDHTARQLEDTILTRARQLKITQSGK